MTAVTLTADGTTSVGGKAKAMVRDSVKTVIAASMVGTAIEFYDFYAYGTAAANYFPHIFFSAKDNPTVALLMSLLTFAIAFIARPLGSLIFGHFGDRMGRKTTLVVSLMTMGVGTFLIGCLPTYSQVGVGAVAVLCLLRFIQGIGLGGEWSGAALVATENAPEDKRALYGSFPELGAPIGFFLSNGTYFVLESFNDTDAMCAWGWRVPFLLSAILKTAQGSSTVALTTTAGIMAPLMDAMGLGTPVRAALTVMAIAAGAMTVSHSNDSYFWVVTNFGEMQPEQGYKTQTLCTLLLGLSSMAGVFVLSLIFR